MFNIIFKMQNGALKPANFLKYGRNIDPLFP